MIYPVMLDVEGADVLVVGGGRVASAKASGLAACGAEVTVVAPSINPELLQIARTVHERTFEPDDVVGRRLVFTATGVPSVDQQVFAAAGRFGIWVNSADDPPRCSFTLPAVLRRGPVVVSVATSGHSPALASYLRDRIADVVPPEVEKVAVELSAQRRQIKAAGGSTEDVDWRTKIEQKLSEIPADERASTEPG